MTPGRLAALRWHRWRHDSGTVTRKTEIQDRDRVSRFVAAVGARPLGPGSVGVWVATLGTLAPASRRAHASTVRTWLRWCELHGLAPSGTAAAVPRYRSPRTVPRALTAPQVTAVRDACPDDRARLVVALMHGLGLRAHEVAHLTTDDLDLGAGTILVRGKGSNERLLPLPDRCAATLAVWLDRCPAGAPLFPGPTGAPVSAATVGRIVRDVMLAAGVKHAARDGRSSHCLRHSAASEVLEAGAPLHVVRELLGHASIATTSVYLRRVDLAGLRAAVAGR